MAYTLFCSGLASLFYNSIQVKIKVTTVWQSFQYLTIIQLPVCCRHSTHSAKTVNSLYGYLIVVVAIKVTDYYLT